MMLQQALQPKGQMTNTGTMDPLQQESMGPEGDIVAQIQEQLQAIEEAFEQTQDPQELRKLSQAHGALMEKLQELTGGATQQALMGGGFPQ